MSERQALDMWAYARPNSEIDEAGLGYSLTSLFLEAGTEAPTYYRIRLTPEGRVVDDFSDGRVDVREQVVMEDELSRKESSTTLARIKVMLQKRVGTLCVWVSPPGGPYGYEEGKIDVGYVTEEGGVLVHWGYGIKTRFDKQTHLLIASRIGEFALTSWPLNSPEDLRDKLFEIQTDDPLALLHEIIPMPEALDSIENGEARRLREMMFQKARHVVRHVKPLLTSAATRWDYMQAGALAERMMVQETGIEISDGPCGLLNSSLVENRSGTQFVVGFAQIDFRGKVTDVFSGSGNREGKYVKSCGKCGKSINAVISKGYKCSCGGAYEGC